VRPYTNAPVTSTVIAGLLVGWFAHRLGLFGIGLLMLGLWFAVFGRLRFRLLRLFRLFFWLAFMPGFLVVGWRFFVIGVARRLICLPRLLPGVGSDRVIVFGNLHVLGHAVSLPGAVSSLSSRGSALRRFRQDRACALNGPAVRPLNS
jgi:hypothetical protein